MDASFIIQFKMLASLIILSIALAAGLIPALTPRFRLSESVLCHGNYLAKGIFFGAGMIHLLPEAIDRYNEIHGGDDHVTILTICAVTLMFLQIAEQAIHKLVHSAKLDALWLPYFLVTILSIHSIFAGIALGLDTNLTTAVALFLAIIAHKGAASFSLSVSMMVRGISARITAWGIILFSLMTPLGIWGATALMDSDMLKHSHVANPFFDAMAAGTFLYIALTSKLKHKPMPAEHTWWNMLWIASGVGIMAVLAQWA